MREAALAWITGPRDTVVVVRKAGTRMWGLPGGKVEDGETLEAAMIREVMEETGIHVSIGDGAPFVEDVADGSNRFRVTTFPATVIEDYVGLPPAPTGFESALIQYPELIECGRYPAYNAGAALHFCPWLRRRAIACQWDREPDALQFRMRALRREFADAQNARREIGRRERQFLDGHDDRARDRSEHLAWQRMMRDRSVDK